MAASQHHLPDVVPIDIPMPGIEAPRHLTSSQDATGVSTVETHVSHLLTQLGVRDARRW